MSLVTLRAPTDSGSISHAGREYFITDGHVEVEGHAADELVDTHGFFRAPGATIVRPTLAQAPAAVAQPGPDEIAVPRSTIVKILEALGVKEPTTLSVPVLRSALAVARETIAEAIADAEKRGEQRALDKLAGDGTTGE